MTVHDLEGKRGARERAFLERKVREAVAGRPGAEDLAARLLGAARLQELEYGDYVVSVFVEGEWLPLDRAVAALWRE